MRVGTPPQRQAPAEAATGAAANTCACAVCTHAPARVCMCVRECARVRARMPVCVCVRACVWVRMTVHMRSHERAVCAGMGACRAGCGGLFTIGGCRRGAARAR